VAIPHPERHAWDRALSSALLAILLALLALGVVSDLRPAPTRVERPA
jgi:hypothetical protein